MKDISVLRRSGWTAGIGGKKISLASKKHRNAPVFQQLPHTARSTSQTQFWSPSTPRSLQRHNSPGWHTPGLHQARSGAEASQKHLPILQNFRITALQGNHFSAYPACKRGPLSKDEGINLVPNYSHCQYQTGKNGERSGRYTKQVGGSWRVPR